MEILSTNTANLVTIRWKGREQQTGIYKKPREEGIFLDRAGIREDRIGNPEVHGGELKACYLFAGEEYPYWKQLYPLPDWGFGMFGENLTIRGLEEKNLRMGAVYRLGGAVIRITTPREPCFKLGIRFRDQGIIEKFIDRGRPGAYGEVLEPGRVRPRDPFLLIDSDEKAPDIAAYYRLLYSEEKDQRLLTRALETEVLPEKSRKQLMRWLS
ncbi:MOSC domain-containing protein [Robiginitalea sp. SC105]|uniref:MOSC domain-containing protein n=1 Tax=Robiginitalea sp. SC105 TaxID=2762332 RepID=UPI00163A798F|nr:MOSC domain-containing protein [Robiginitalea sp. SC105]MBC2839168.1 MOSC domain-containing protein [Robiginitalea sp. SC105]